MKVVVLLILLLGTGSLKAGNVLFELGSRDSSAAEFALSPDGYQDFLASFGGVKTFYVGYSDAGKHWSYVLPGPLDGWAGGGYWAGFYPRHFPMLCFQLERVTLKGECSLNLFFAAINRKDNRIRIEINGHRIERGLEGKDDVEALEGKASGNPVGMEVRFPASWLVVGVNTIQIGMVKGSWAVFDCIRLETPEKMRLGKASSSLVRRAVAARFEYREEDGSRAQPVLVEMTQIDVSVS